jgi:hypothetical protein
MKGKRTGQLFSPTQQSEIINPSHCSLFRLQFPLSNFSFQLSLRISSSQPARAVEKQGLTPYRRSNGINDVIGMVIPKLDISCRPAIFPS